MTKEKGSVLSTHIEHYPKGGKVVHEVVGSQGGWYVLKIGLGYDVAPNGATLDAHRGKVITGVYRRKTAIGFAEYYASGRPEPDIPNLAQRFAIAVLSAVRQHRGTAQ